MDTKDGVEGVWEASNRVRAEEVRGLEGLVAGLDRGKDAVDTRGGAKKEEDPDAMDTS